MVSALKENQDNLCNLPKEIENFVGRDHETKESKELLLKGEKFLLITGGPCYGKSSLANDLGHSLFKKPFNYVIQIGMRDITSSAPTLEDVAQNILKGFQIDTTEMQNEIVNFLIRKFESITISGKKALLIFDNADSLIAQHEGRTCQSTTYEKLCNIIRNMSRESSIRCIFTTRVCNDLEQNNDDHCIIKLDRISNEESKEFIRIELADVTGFDMEQSIKELVSISYGLPMALQLITSKIKKLRHKDVVEGYISNLKKDTFGTVAKYSNLEKLLAFSLDYLDESDKELLSLLAVFPSRFSYKYTKMLITFAKKDQENIEIRLQNLEDHSLIQDDSRDDGESQNEFLRGKFYMMHPFFCQFIKEKYWVNDKGHTCEISYCSLYIQQLLSLAGRALEKGKYVNCLGEFQAEQHNYFDVMEQIGRSLEADNQPSYLEKTFRKELSGMTTPDFIAQYLFCIDLMNPSSLLKYFEGCIALVNDEIKKDIWCCIYDLNMKYYDRKIDDSHSQLKPGKYGGALLDKRNIASTLYNSHMNKTIEKNFQEILHEIKRLEDRVETLECTKMKAYFKHKALKSKGDWLKKGLKIKSLDIKRDECIDAYISALKICEENFGDSWLTIDCHNQLGKLHWSLKEYEEATQQFDNAIRSAESMSLTNNKKFASCLLDKGRFLIDTGDEKNMAEGVVLLEDVIKRCMDITHAKFWCKAMESLFIADESKVGVAKEEFFHTDKLHSSAMVLMEEATRFDLNFFDVDMEEEKFWECKRSKMEDLLKAIAHLEEILQDSREDCDENDFGASLITDAKEHLFVWRTRAVLDYKHVLPLIERKEHAQKALETIHSCSINIIYHKQEEDLRSVLNQTCDPKEENQSKKMYYIDLVGKHLIKEGNGDELIQKDPKMLEKCEDDQTTWSSIVLKISRNNPAFYENVTDLLIRQSAPCEGLLKLVNYKFNYEIRIYAREANEQIIIYQSRKAVDDLEKAIRHLESLLLHKATLRTDISKRLSENLLCWYERIVFDTEHCLKHNERARYANEIVQNFSDLTDDLKKKLNEILTRDSTEGEQEEIRKKSLLIKVTKFMRENGMQDQLEKKYEEFLINCSSYPLIRYEMIKFIINMKNIEISKFSRYLTFLTRHFQDGSLNSGLHYKFIIDHADDLFSYEMDHSSRAKNFEICHSIYKSLSRTSPKIKTGLRKKLEFEFLAIFSLKISNDRRDASIKKQDARHALAIFPKIPGKFRRDEKLLRYREELERLVR